METVFNFCVELLLDLADLTGMTYKEINVWIFCIIWPVIIIALCVRNIQFSRRIKFLEKQMRKRDNKKAH